MCVKTEKRLLFLGIIYDKIKKVVQLVMFPYCITFFHETAIECGMVFWELGGNIKAGRNFLMSVQLLDKTRKINNLLHNNNSHKGSIQ